MSVIYEEALFAKKIADEATSSVLANLFNGTLLR